jgi:hypothetical protein
MDDVVIYPSKLKRFMGAAGSLLFIGLGIYFAKEREFFGLPVWPIIIISYVGILFFGSCFAYVLYRLLRPAASVIISQDGLLDNASAASAGMLKWEEIAEIFPYNFMGQQMLGIIPKDTEAVLARQHFVKKILARINNRLAKAPFNIPQSALPFSVAELAKRIEEYWPITP